MNDGKMVYPRFPHTGSGAGTGITYRINEKGDILGNRDGVSYLGVYPYGEGDFTAIRTLGGPNSQALDLNDLGEVVGRSSTERANAPDPDYTPHAFLWRGGTMIDLNSVIPSSSEWVLEAARAINNRGQIVGLGWHKGDLRAFRLTPQ